MVAPVFESGFQEVPDFGAPLVMSGEPHQDIVRKATDAEQLSYDRRDRGLPGIYTGFGLGFNYGLEGQELVWEEMTTLTEQSSGAEGTEGTV